VAEKKCYAKHKKYKGAKQAKLAKEITKAMAVITPFIGVKSSADTTFDSDRSALGSAVTIQNCAQARTILNEAGPEQQTAESDTTKFTNAIQTFVLLLA
jgi:hypothetical protein